MDNDTSNYRLPRRKVLQWFAAAAAASDGLALPVFGQAASGYGTDPKVAAFYNPGDFWDLTFSAAEKKAATALADIILPADDFGPAASAVRVPDFVDEWISAPYPRQQGDREVVRPGLQWIDQEAQTRFQKIFSDLTGAEKASICDDLCRPEGKDAKMKEAAQFFHVFSGLCMGAYYSTTEGWKAIGYVGNMPITVFEGPPQEVLDQLGLEQTVKD